MFSAQTIMMRATQSGRNAATESGRGIIVNISATTNVTRTGKLLEARNLLIVVGLCCDLVFASRGPDQHDLADLVERG